MEQNQKMNPKPAQKPGSDRILVARQIRDGGRRQSIPCGDDAPITNENNALINLIREGDTVREIHLRCSCGALTRIVCQYPEPTVDQHARS